MRFLTLFASTALLGIVVSAGTASAQSYDFDDGPPPPPHHRWWGYPPPPPPPPYGWHRQMRWDAGDYDDLPRPRAWRRPPPPPPMNVGYGGYGPRRGFDGPDCE